MITKAKDVLKNIEVKEAVEADTLQVFGLHWTAEHGAPYVTLDDALQAETLEITEVSESGSVPTLKVGNHGDARVLLVSGETLIGAKQNRVLNVSILVGEHTDLEVPVSCVESGRWAYRSAKFRGSGSSSHSYLRREVADGVAESYRRSGKPSSRQGRVWAEINRKLCRLGSRSGSSDLNKVFEDYSSRLDGIVKKIRVSNACNGVAFAFGGRVVGIDIFDRSATLQKLLPKLVRAFAIDAIEEAAVRNARSSDNPKPPPQASESRPLHRESVAEWLRDACGLPAETFDSPGIGQDVRFESDGFVGGCLVVDGHPLHLELFAKDVPDRK